MKGIILAGGRSTRLYPATSVLCKQLLPVYDKPLIYYPLSTLMLAGIRDILIVSTPDDLNKFKDLLGDGSNLGIKLSYEKQLEPRGLADAFIIGEKFIGKDSVCLILGDNIFYGNGLTEMLKDSYNQKDGATIFGYAVKDPERYGNVEFDPNYNVISIEEKPQNPKSRYAVVGLYFYDNDVIEIAKKLKPSARGELEITDINKKYLEAGKLKVKLICRGFAWFDAGTFDSLADATSFVKSIQDRQELKIACIEEIAYQKGWINKEQLIETANNLKNSGYGDYLLNLLKN